MKVYVGQTRSRSLVGELRGLGYGEMTSRGELPPRRRPWAFDNGAFSDWKSQRPFDADAFRRDVDHVAALVDRGDRPDFIVCPDIVAGGPRSLEFSLAWAPHLVGLAPIYLAVQDGMRGEDIARVCEMFAGLFIGGSLDWKLNTGGAWSTHAHALGLACHVGRVGTYNRVRWAQFIGADSIDSCLPLWSRDRLSQFRDALEGTAAQQELGTNAWGRVGRAPVRLSRLHGYTVTKKPARKKYPRPRRRS